MAELMELVAKYGATPLCLVAVYFLWRQNNQIADKYEALLERVVTQLVLLNTELEKHD